MTLNHLIFLYCLIGVISWPCGEGAFPGGTSGKEPPPHSRNNAGHVRDLGSITGSGRSPGGEHGNPLQ